MKKLCIFITVAALFGMLPSCNYVNDQSLGLAKSEAEKQEEGEKLPQRRADIAVGQIRYIKDPRTGICFAYVWGGDLNGVQALATVPEDKIPPDLLRIGEKYDK